MEAPSDVCPKLQACPFFNDRMKGMDGMTQLYKKRYCTSNFETCARWTVSKAGVAVPADLFPNQQERVAEVLALAATTTVATPR